MCTQFCSRQNLIIEQLILSWTAGRKLGVFIFYEGRWIQYCTTQRFGNLWKPRTSEERKIFVIIWNISISIPAGVIALQLIKNQKIWSLSCYVSKIILWILNQWYTDAICDSIAICNLIQVTHLQVPVYIVVSDSSHGQE